MKRRISSGEPAFDRVARHPGKGDAVPGPQQADRFGKDIALHCRSSQIASCLIPGKRRPNAFPSVMAAKMRCRMRLVAFCISKIAAFCNGIRAHAKTARFDPDTRLSDPAISNSFD